MFLRKQAEARVADESVDVSHKSPDQIKALLHDLHVHQIELELQNDQLRATQVELELARERLSELYDFAPVSYLTLNQAGEILQANLTSVTMLGIQRTKLLSQKFNRFVLSADQERYYTCLRKVFSEREKQVCELRLRPGSGAIFFGRLEAVWAMENEQAVCRMTLSDITDQKRAEERCREIEGNQVQYESEEWKRLALEAGELGAWDHDLLKESISCSGAACQMIGFDEKALPQWEEIVERIHVEDRLEFLRQIDRSTLPDGTGRVDTVFRVCMPGGEVRWLRMLARTSFGMHKGALRALRRTGVLADITQLKRAEEMLRTHAERLKVLVRERTSRLEQAVAELEHLSYTLVHDLRAPLRAITGYTVLLLEQCKDLQPVHRMYLQRSSAAAVRMDNLIVDALSYSQINRHHSTLEPIDALSLLRQLLDTYPQFQEAAKCIKVEEPWPLVIGNAALLTQCFSNLLTNALKFVAPGQKPSVRIHAEPSEKRVRIWFDDQGIGIDVKGREKIFRMFQRLQTQYEGTGIGLALVKKAVERMNGHVGVESEPGRGSHFWLELEKADESAEAKSHRRKAT
jgi:PAS domain S-box-containing protein